MWITKAYFKVDFFVKESKVYQVIVIMPQMIVTETLSTLSGLKFADFRSI